MRLYNILRATLRLYKRRAAQSPSPALQRANATFTGLLEKLSNLPILAFPQPLLPYELHTDPSPYQVGCSLFKIYPDRSRRKVGFWSRTLKSAEKNYSPTERECLAVIYRIATCRPYLYGQKFTVVTDHHSFRWLLEINDPASGRLMRWCIRLAELYYDIEYRKWSQHTQLEALFHLPATGHTTEHADLDISCLSLNSASYRQHIDAKSDSDEEASSEIKLDITPIYPISVDKIPNPLPQPLASITITELVNSQRHDTFCQQVPKSP